MRLAGRRICVTGGSSGIGRALTIEYSRQGAQVWSVARRADALEETRRAGEPNLIAGIAADLMTNRGRHQVARRIEAADAEVDVVVHAAGLLGPPNTPLETYPADPWYEVFEANVSSVHFLHQELVPLLGDNPTVIGVSSTVGRKGRALWGMYAVSKFAIEGWLEVLTDEWQGRGRVYSVNPGGTATPMRAAAVPDEDPATLPTPQDVTPVFLRLAHPRCPEPSGAKLEARDWIGSDPWRGIA